MSGVTLSRLLLLVLKQDSGEPCGGPQLAAGYVCFSVLTRGYEFPFRLLHHDRRECGNIDDTANRPDETNFDSDKP
jgi:hypothetical protein